MNENNRLFSSVQRLMRTFSTPQKSRFYTLLVFSFFGSLADLIGLSMVIPIVGLVLSPTFYSEIAEYLPFVADMGKEQVLLWSVGLFFVLIIAKNAFGLYINYLQVQFVRNLFVSSTQNVLRNIFRKPLQTVLSTSSNTWINKVTNMQVALCSHLSISLMIVINEAMVFLLTATIVCLWNWQLFILLIVVLIPTIGLFYYKVKDRIRRAGDEKNRRFSHLYAYAQEMIHGYTDVKIAGTEQNFQKSFKNEAKRYSYLQSRVDFALFIPTRLIEVAIFMCIVLILLYGVYVIKDINEIVTTITLFSVIAYRSIPSVNRFVMAMNQVNASEYVLDDPDFYFQEYEEKNRKEKADPIPFHREISIRDISFRYEDQDRTILHHCSLTIAKGEKIGIIGKSGSGKSTLVNNLLGFLRPTRGEIHIDGQRLDASNQENWWRIVGYVRQDAFILNRSLAENIALGETPENIDFDQLRKAIAKASLSQLLDEMPDGWDTVLSERGNNLSGGQRQRIAIARALYKGAQVLIFDEATSALDSGTEEEITNAINALGTSDLTVVIIAHRYTSLKFCEKIYKLDAGSVSDVYTYPELVASVE